VIELTGLDCVAPSPGVFMQSLPNKSLGFGLGLKSPIFLDCFVQSIEDKRESPESSSGIL
jgi:hypothetical protein